MTDAARAGAGRARAVVSRLVLPRQRSTNAPEAVAAAAAGNALLAGTGVILLASAPLLDANRRGWIALVTIGALVAAALLTSARLEWPRLPRRATLVFPFLVCGALSAASAAQPGLTAPLTGIVTLCFAYIGSTQRPWTSLWLLPAAGGTLVAGYGGFTSQVVVRLVLAMAVWTLVAELLARPRTRRQEPAASSAVVDPLTGVPDRRDLEVRLTRLGVGDTLVACDLDHFKIINDTLGHSFGDRVLSEFGSVLRATLRGQDYCARFGDSQFALLLTGASHGQAQTLLSRLREHWATLQPAVTFSAGVATHVPDRSAAATLEAADAALRVAKDAGRNTTRVEQREAHASA
ncbi:diguanylate cyclase [uncultured Jatrophihabitans sp.]|uniref:GGDEF domain-containing protein n=1 Tax=uncultured Jatrophihabitans sp. TaxID=1610747 RepID=UPI0035CAD4B0